MPYGLLVTPKAQRLLSEALPEKIATAAIDFITGPLLDNPQRVGGMLTGSLEGSRSARLGEYRILYNIEDANHRVVVFDIGHRRDVYKAR